MNLVMTGNYTRPILNIFGDSQGDFSIILIWFSHSWKSLVNLQNIHNIHLNMSSIWTYKYIYMVIQMYLKIIPFPKKQRVKRQGMLTIWASMWKVHQGVQVILGLTVPQHPGTRYHEAHIDCDTAKHLLPEGTESQHGSKLPAETVKL